MKSVELSTERASQKDEDSRIEEKSKLRSISRQLLRVTSQTRTDASFDSCRVSNIWKNPKVMNLLETNKAVQKLQFSTSRLVYPDLGNPEYLKIIASGDATHRSLPSGASQGVRIVFLCGNNRAVPITIMKIKVIRTSDKNPNSIRNNGSCRISRCRQFCCFDDKRELWN